MWQASWQGCRPCCGLLRFLLPFYNPAESWELPQKFQYSAHHLLRLAIVGKLWVAALWFTHVSIDIKEIWWHARARNDLDDMITLKQMGIVLRRMPARERVSQLHAWNKLCIGWVSVDRSIVGTTKMWQGLAPSTFQLILFGGMLSAIVLFGPQPTLQADSQCGGHGAWFSVARPVLPSWRNLLHLVRQYRASR